MIHAAENFTFPYSVLIYIYSACWNLGFMYYIFLNLLAILLLEVTLTQNTYRAGHRINSLESLNPRGDRLLEKILTQATYVSSGSMNNNIYANEWLGHNCYITPADNNRIIRAAHRAEALGELGPALGFKIGTNSKLCCVNGLGNMSVKASSNLFHLVFVY